MTKQTFTPTWIAAAVLALSAATMVHAQPAAGEAKPAAAQTGDHAQHDAKGKRQGQRDPAKRAEARAKNLAKLKQKLNLTPEQEPAWNQYQAAMQSPERLQHTDATKTHNEMAKNKKARAEATKVFYAQLTPAQQQVLDAKSARKDKQGQRKAGKPASAPAQ